MLPGLHSFLERQRPLSFFFLQVFGRIQFLLILSCSDSRWLPAEGLSWFVEAKHIPWLVVFLRPHQCQSLCFHTGAPSPFVYCLCNHSVDVFLILSAILGYPVNPVTWIIQATLPIPRSLSLVTSSKSPVRCKIELSGLKHGCSHGLWDQDMEIFGGAIILSTMFREG